jgi:hypothetical protein
MPEVVTQKLLMGFEGVIYIGPAGKTAINDTSMILADSIREPKYSVEYSDVDATMRKHQGIKAHMKGILDFEITFTLPNLKNSDGTRPTDTALILSSLQARQMPLTIFMLDEASGEGIMGDFEIFGGNKTEADEDVQAWEITARPSAAGRHVTWYTTPVL